MLTTGTPILARAATLCGIWHEQDFLVPSLDRPTTGHRDDFVSEKSPSAVMAAAPMALGEGLFRQTSAPGQEMAAASRVVT